MRLLATVIVATVCCAPARAATPGCAAIEAATEAQEPAHPARGPICTWLHRHFFGDEAVDPGYANREETRRFICCSSDDFFAKNWRRPSPLPSDQPPR